MTTKLKTVDLKDNKKVISLIPEHKGHQVLVDAVVLKRLVAAMKYEGSEERRDRLIKLLAEADNHSEVDNILEKDMNWQKTIASIDLLNVEEIEHALMPEKVTDKNLDQLIG